MDRGKQGCCRLSLQQGKSFHGAQFSNAPDGLFQSYSYQGKKAERALTILFGQHNFAKRFSDFRTSKDFFQFLFSSFWGRSDNTFHNYYALYLLCTMYYAIGALYLAFCTFHYVLVSADRERAWALLVCEREKGPLWDTITQSVYLHPAYCIQKEQRKKSN